MKVVYMVGPLSSTSLNRGLAKIFVSLAPEGVESVDLDIGSLPLYNCDYDGNWPEVATAFKKTIDEVDSAVIITPEHDRVYSAAVANVIEWFPRPWGAASFEGKPVALAGVSPGSVVTGIAQTYLRSPLTLFGLKLYSHETYIDA